MRFTRRSLLSSGPLAAASAHAARAAGRPNFLFIISDDHTAADLGCYGNAAVTSPNLDRLAQEGTRFTRCFVASPQCSPNRSAILTGCAPHTTSTSRLHTPMPDWEPTVLEPFKERGYFTGAYRKVHQGAEFDKRWHYYGNAQATFEEFFEKLPAGRPFYLHVGFTEPHRPYKPGAFSPPHDPGAVRVPAFLPGTADVRQDLAWYYDYIAKLDAQIGSLFGLLRRRGLDGNTLVLFTGDNGMPFPRAKGTLYEPGINVPLIARWPGRVAPGAVHDELISHVDLAPTWLDAAGIAKPSKMQGRSFLPLLDGTGGYQSREEVFSERNWHDNFDPMRSIRTRRHKLIFNAAPHQPYRPAWDLEDSLSWKSILSMRRRQMRPEHARLLAPTRPVLELYDLEKDPWEFVNLIDDPAQAGIRTELEKRLGEWMHRTLDFLPSPGPGFPRTL